MIHAARFLVATVLWTLVLWAPPAVTVLALLGTGIAACVLVVRGTGDGHWG